MIEPQRQSGEGPPEDGAIERRVPGAGVGWRRQAGIGASARKGPDRATVALLATAAFLLVLAFLTLQLGGVAASRTRPALVRRIYETKVIERVPAGAPGATSVTQSSSSPYSTGAGPVTGSSR